jgi:hypothetical protein
MIIHAAKDELIWEEVNHHVLNRVTAEVANMFHAEALYYKNDDLSVRSTFKRFCGYITIIIGIFNMLISKTGQATHDKIAHTVVIKS